MSYYPPPTENVAIFDEINFRSGENLLTQADADRRYLRYPNAQGTENLQAINVNGVATFSNTITAPGDLFINPVGSVDLNGKTLNMTNGEIHNCPLVHSRNNQNIIIEGKGTGDVILKTNNVNRLTIDDTGFQTFEGGMTYNNATDTLSATTFSGSATNVKTTSDNTNATYYIPYVSSAGSGKTLYVDDVTGPLSYNPTTGELSASSTLKINGVGGNNNVFIGAGAAAGVTSTDSVCIGSGASATQQLANCVSIGKSAGATQYADCVAIGSNAGFAQQAESVAIGRNAGQTSQGSQCVAIGALCGDTQNSGNVAIGYLCGRSQSSYATAVGRLSGNLNQGNNATAIGTSAAQKTQGANAVAVGVQAGQYAQGSAAIAIGLQAGQAIDGTAASAQGANAVAIGNAAGRYYQTAGAVAIGSNAGSGSTTASSGQGTSAIAIGDGSGQYFQTQYAISIGVGAGGGTTIAGTGQLQDAIGIGRSAGQNTQGVESVAIGFTAGQSSQGTKAIAIGSQAGRGITTSQGANNIAIGELAQGTRASGTSCIAIGTNAGQGTTSAQGNNSIAIGNQAAVASQTAGSICLNASGVATNPNQAGFFVRPIRGVASATPVCVYDAVNFEVTYNTSSIKYKKNVIDLSGDTSSIYNVRAREYDAKDDDKHFMGYIAEEVDAVDTRFTWKNPDGTPEGIEWFNMLIYTIEEMKKLKQEIEILKNR